MGRSKKRIISAIFGTALAAVLSLSCGVITVSAESEDNDNITVEEPDDTDNILDNIDLGNTDDVKDPTDTPAVTTPVVTTPVDVTPTNVTPTNTTPKTGVDVVPAAVTATGSALACLGAAALFAVKRKTK